VCYAYNGWGVRVYLQAVGEDTSREGLERTPNRAAKALMFFTSGYNKTLDDVIGEGVFDISTDIALHMNAHTSKQIERNGVDNSSHRHSHHNHTDSIKKDSDGVDMQTMLYAQQHTHGGVLSSSGIVCVRNIDLYSLCEHHMVPFFGKRCRIACCFGKILLQYATGKVHIAYLPHKKIIGLSKLARIADLFARRLQVLMRYSELSFCYFNMHIGFS
jgi:GTP cyclohydrolase I